MLPGNPCLLSKIRLCLANLNAEQLYEVGQKNISLFQDVMCKLLVEPMSSSGALFISHGTSC